jgi:pimeloyl-ACP methyl ester carboxylesterase
VVPYYAELDAARRAQADSLLRFVQRVVAESRTRIAQFPQNQIDEIHGGNHFVFLQRPREVAAAMRAFLSSDSVPQRANER